MGIKISDAFPSNWLKADDIPKGKKVRCKIREVQMEKCGEGDKPVCYFASKDKGLVLNKTNAAALAAVYGDDTDDWIDQEVLLYVAQVSYQGRMVPAIRVETPMVEAVEDEEPPF